MMGSLSTMMMMTVHPRRRRWAVAATATATVDDHGVRKEDIVIVGAGIAGLATAVALQRLYYFMH